MVSAFCPLYFAAHGGKFDHLGKPYVPSDAEYVRGKCPRAVDCGECPLLRQWIEARMVEGWQVAWLCTDCMKKAVPVGKVADRSRWYAPGYYQSSSQRLWEEEVVDSGSSLIGCTDCLYGSSVLQLVLRR